MWITRLTHIKYLDTIICICCIAIIPLWFSRILSPARSAFFATSLQMGWLTWEQARLHKQLCIESKIIPDYGMIFFENSSLQLRQWMEGRSGLSVSNKHIGYWYSRLITLVWLSASHRGILWTTTAICIFRICKSATKPWRRRTHLRVVLMWGRNFGLLYGSWAPRSGNWQNQHNNKDNTQRTSTSSTSQEPPRPAVKRRTGWVRAIYCLHSNRHVFNRCLLEGFVFTIVTQSEEDAWNYLR